MIVVISDLHPARFVNLDRLRLSAFAATLARHQTLLWWLHSCYALLFGIGVMWVGARRPGFLRLAVVYVGFVWLTSLPVPSIARLAPLSPAWRERIRLLVNYLNRNFYQQVLFFLLPIYWASATIGSRNTLFIVLLALSAVISTLDVVYDRHLSVRRSLVAVFVAFNLFASINAMLPTIWSVANAAALRPSALLALAAFVTIRWTPADLTSLKQWFVLGAVAASLLMVVTWGRPFIPPAPLSLASAAFGTSFDPARLNLRQTLDAIPADYAGPLFVLTTVDVPRGLEDRVAHRWYENGRLVYSSPVYTLVGGRESGYRLWTWRTVNRPGPATTIRVDVETEAGQLIGRAEIRTE